MISLNSIRVWLLEFGYLVTLLPLALCDLLLCCVHTDTFFDTLSVKAAGKCPVEGVIDGHDEAQIDTHARHSLQHSFRHSLVFSRYTTVKGEGCARRLTSRTARARNSTPLIITSERQLSHLALPLVF